MRPENITKLDLGIAKSVLNILIGVSSADKAVAGVILAHLNTKSGQCDPSIGRIARILGIDEATVKRATRDLCGKHGLFKKVSHGGNANRASYEPCWTKFRDLNDDFQRRVRSGEGPNSSSGNSAEMPPQTAQKCALDGGKNALQTILKNSIEELYLSEPPQEEPLQGADAKPGNGLSKRGVAEPLDQHFRSRERAATQGSSHDEAAMDAARYRLNAAIEKLPVETKAVVWDWLDERLMEEAYRAEVKRPNGGGMAFINIGIRTRRLEAIEASYRPVH
ncbi:hypothetical protein ACCT04_14650 [Rhizobium ruizarguesonis]